MKPAAEAPLTPSDTLNNLAHAPVNAVNKAQDAVNARRGSEQTRIDALAAGEDPAAKKPVAADAAKGATKGAPASKPAVVTSTTLAPGISATTTDVEAVAEASPAFRTFVANARISGVIGGDGQVGGVAAKIILNNRPYRSGDVIDTILGITFENVDSEKKLLIFKDKTGAIVTRKY